MRHITHFIFLFFATQLHASSAIFCGDPTHLHQTDTFLTDDCQILVLEDCTGHRLALKMVLDPDAEEQALLVIDCCASAIAEATDLPINRVRLVPECQPWLELPWFIQLATMHEWAPGMSAQQQLPWEDFTLQQRYREPGSAVWEQWGPLPEHKQGLSREVLQTMACHKDLARIAALDTFLGNADRSLPNVFYDAGTGRFMGIDQAAAFRRPLARIALQQLKSMQSEGFSDDERLALGIYRETLSTLYAAVTPEIVAETLSTMAEQSGLEGITHRLQVAMDRFGSNYQDVYELITLLALCCVN